MKLIVATIQDQDADRVTAALTTGGYRVTRIGSSGGFLREGNVTLLIGVDDAAVSDVTTRLGRDSQRRTKFLPVASGTMPSGMALTNYVEVQVGGATIFVLDVEQFEQI